MLKKDILLPAFLVFGAAPMPLWLWLVVWLYL